MDVVVTGAGGQLGRELVGAWGDDEVAGLTRDELDVTDEGAVLATIAELAPEVVVNCAAWTAVDACEEEPERAHRVNALAPWWLARACRTVGARLVHVSTDYVFGGDAPRRPDGTVRGWTEFDAVDPRSVYGRSKAAGEQLVRATLREHHIVRTAWVCGAYGRNFVTTMLELADRGGPVRVVDDQYGSPTFTADLAVALRQLAASDRHGTWHRTNAGHTSWYGLAAATFELAGRDVDLGPQPSTALDRPAPRPPWSVLDATHATAAGLRPLPPWRDGLRALLGELGELA
jgi:dTDP-4-dehydrorhamnose reductase